MPKPLTVSYSSVQDWRTCEQKYYYAYVDRLMPKVARGPLELGSLLHGYLDSFYRAGLRGKPDKDAIHKAHRRAMRTVGEQGKKIESLAETARGLGAEDQAKELLRIPRTAKDILIAYYRVHGIEDMRKHQVILVEDRFSLPVKKGVVLPGRIDLVTKDKNGFWLWEHKTTTNVPRPDSRFRDFQTLIYTIALEELHGVKPVGIIWNYIRTVPPHEPKLLKRGGLSVAKGQTTTVDLFMGACIKHKQSLKDYRPYLRRLEAWERDTMLPRYALPISASENVLMRDYLHTVEDIEAVRSEKDYAPIRNISLNCNWCSYVKLCQAVILGGDINVLVRKYFTTSDTKKKGGENQTYGQDEIETLLEA